MKKTIFLSLIMLFFLETNVTAQAYPYAFYPNSGKSSEHSYGLVSKDQNKITEPLYNFIGLFLNQEKNNYAVFRKEKESELGIIDNKGNIISGISSNNLEYNGNGRIVRINDNDGIRLFNIKENKYFYEKAQMRLIEIVASEPYFAILQDYQTKQYLIIDDNGKPFPVEANSGQPIEYIKELDEKAIFGFKEGRYKYKYYNADGIEVAEDDVYYEPEFFDQAVMESRDDIAAEDARIKKELLQIVKDSFPGFELGDLYKNNYDNIQLAEIIKDRNVGLINLKGELVLPCEYQKISRIKTDMYEDGRDDKFYLEYKKYASSGIITIYGKILLPAKYGFIRYEKEAKMFSMMTDTGYFGYFSPRDKLYLPKECACF